MGSGGIQTKVDFALQSSRNKNRSGLLYLYDTDPGEEKPGRRAPLFILPRNGASLLGGEGEISDSAALRTYGLYADLPLGEDVGIHWAIGYATLKDEGTRKKAWEYNVGVAYRVLENLMYEAHFGYLSTGEQAGAPVQEEPSAAAIEQVYLITNKVTMRF